MQADLESSI